MTTPKWIQRLFDKFLDQDRQAMLAYKAAQMHDARALRKAACKAQERSD